jgi:hydroxyethylthiazole kinase-like uncharacterized protein yjeF
MQRAGAATAAEIALRYPDRMAAGVLVLVGPGNNGGDGWVVARALAASGARVRVCEAAPVTAPDAQAERMLAIEHVELVLPSLEVDAFSNADIYRGESIVVDAVLGTGASGPPRGPLAAMVRGLRAMRERGATIVAVDLPTGVDATTGELHTPVRCDATFTYGTLKRGHLLARAACGRVVVLDIGLRLPADDDVSPELISGGWVAERLPDIPADAHKGTKKKLAIVGGGPGMTGAAILAARGAWRSGIGMVKLVVSQDSLAAVQEAEPQSLTAAWPQSAGEVERDIAKWADVVAIGPGLGGGSAARELVERIVGAFDGPVVLDADAINAFSSDVNALARVLGSGRAVLTPHPAEFARLSGIAVDDVLARRFDVGLAVARHTRAVVLLKGQPTVVTDPSGAVLVSASGTPLLAAAGSGDLLTGMVATLLGQTKDPLVAAAAAAYVHGRAAWLAQKGRGVRGLSLDDVIAELPRAWRLRARPARSPVLFELPPIV